MYITWNISMKYKYEIYVLIWVLFVLNTLMVHLHFFFLLGYGSSVDLNLQIKVYHFGYFSFFKNEYKTNCSKLKIIFLECPFLF